MSPAVVDYNMMTVPSLEPDVDGRARILRPRVLVLTTPVDPTADMVLTHLQGDGVPFLRLDAAQPDGFGR